MRITALRATRVRVPRLARFLPRTAKGETAVNDYVILQLECSGDADVVGIGEVTCAPRWNGEEAAGTVHLVRAVLDGALQGLDPTSWSAVADRFDRCVRGRPFLRAGVEMACLDAVGRHYGLSAAVLLGGARRNRVATKLVLPARDPEAVAAMAVDALGLGAQCLKVKVGVGLSGDLARLDAVRRAARDDIHLTVDANEGWPTDRPSHLAGLLDERRIAAVEQPFPRTATAATVAFRRASTAAIVADESLWDARDLDDAHRTFDVVALYPGKCGGLRRTIRLAEAARDHGLAVTLGSNLELGPGAAAMAQVAAVVPELAGSIPSDLIGPLYAEHPLLTDSSFVRWDGATVPTGPGLGIDLDPDALRSYAVDPADRP
jgi:L-alanine-DL-glutamate epimerase-like enolase superfamily enzyme